MPYVAYVAYDVSCISREIPVAKAMAEAAKPGFRRPPLLLSRVHRSSIAAAVVEVLCVVDVDAVAPFIEFAIEALLRWIFPCPRERHESAANAARARMHAQSYQW